MTPCGHIFDYATFAVGIGYTGQYSKFNENKHFSLFNSQLEYFKEEKQSVIT